MKGTIYYIIDQAHTHNADNIPHNYPCSQSSSSQSSYNLWLPFIFVSLTQSIPESVMSLIRTLVVTDIYMVLII